MRDTSAYGDGEGPALYFNALDSGSVDRNVARIVAGASGSNSGILSFQTRVSGTVAERARIDSSGTFRVKGAGTAGVTDAVQLNGSAPSNSLIINASGQVGLGTSSPGRELHISGAGTSGTQLQIQGTSASASAGIKFTPNSGDNWELQAAADSKFFLYNRTDEAYRLVVDGAGRVGIGTTTVDNKLQVVGDVGIGDIGTSGTYDLYWAPNTAGGSVRWFRSEGSAFSLGRGTTAGISEDLKVDGSGRLLVGTSSSVTSSVSQQSLLQVYSTSSASSSVQIGNYTNGANPAGLHFDKSRGSLGTNTVLQSGDNIGDIKFNGADGTNLVRAASIGCAVDGTPGANDMPGRLVFSTTADGASSPTERMRITSTGTVKLNAPAYNSAAQLQLDAKDTTAYAPPSPYPANQIELQNSVSMGSAIMRFRTQSSNGSAGIWNVGGVPRTSSLKSDFIFQSRTADSTYSEIARFSGDGGILFNGDTAAANALDDYEEGTWIPDLQFGSANTGITYNTRNGFYVKTGKTVFIRGGFVLQNKGTATGLAQIAGLPFTIESRAYADCTGIGGTGGMPGGSGPPVLVGANNNTRVTIWFNTTTNSSRDLADQNNFNNNTELYFSMVYEAD
jgi:hypothetical protein